MQRFCLVIILILVSSFVPMLAQTGPPLPQRTVSVKATQDLNFGSLSILQGSSGGSVTVTEGGTRTKVGSVILLNQDATPSQAIFEVKICPGRFITLTYPETISLANGSSSMLLHIGPTSLGVSGSNFVSNKGCDDRHLISLGGTLDVGPIDANPAGTYTGTFSLTFIQQ